MSRTSRRSRKLPKESRTIPLKGNKISGNGEDFKRYYRCWHCGFTCDETRDSLGDAQSRSGVHAVTYQPTSYPEGKSVMGGSITHYQTSLKLGSDGEPQDLWAYYKPEVSGGCPMCGSLNWRGDYP